MIRIQSEFIEKMEPLSDMSLLNSLVSYIIFVKSKEGNFVAAVVAGPRKRKVGIVVPGNFLAFFDDLRVATVLSAEILKFKKKYSHFELAYTEAKIIKLPIIKWLLAFKYIEIHIDNKIWSFC